MTRIGLAAASIGLAAATLTACGGGDDFADQSAEEMVDASNKAMADLKSLKVSGAITTEGQEIELDIQTNTDGDCVGSLGVDGGTAEIIGVDGETWFRPDSTFWEASAGESAEQIMAIVGDKWVVVPAGEDGFGEFCDLNSLLDEMLEEDDDDDATFEKGDTTEVDGADAIAINRTHPEDGESTGYILTDDPHYLVKLERTGEDSGTMTFSEFDEQFDAEAPATEDVVDLGS